MPLKVRDLLDFSEDGKVDGKFKILAGKGGLERVLWSVGIADYEFSDGFDSLNEESFEKNSLVISSLLFAKDNPEKILEAVKELCTRYKTSCFAFKNVLFESMPKEVIDFANKNDYPILEFGKDLVFERIIYQIMEDIRRDDAYYLSEEQIKKMISLELSKKDVEKMANSISLVLKTYSMACYITGKGIDKNRLRRMVMVNKSLMQKCIAQSYGEGLFILLTSNICDEKAFLIIEKEVREVLGLDIKDISFYRSQIHSSFENLDACFRESFYTYKASMAFNKKYEKYGDLGTIRAIIPLKNNQNMIDFSHGFLRPIMEQEELFVTAICYVLEGGQMEDVASKLRCHQNTVRNRLGKIKNFVGLRDKSDMEFYEEISLAIKIYLLEKGE